MNPTMSISEVIGYETPVTKIKYRPYPSIAEVLFDAEEHMRAIELDGTHDQVRLTQTAQAEPDPSGPHTKLELEILKEAYELHEKKARHHAKHLLTHFKQFVQNKIHHDVLKSKNDVQSQPPADDTPSLDEFLVEVAAKQRRAGVQAESGPIKEADLQSTSQHGVQSPRGRSRSIRISVPEIVVTPADDFVIPNIVITEHFDS